MLKAARELSSEDPRSEAEMAAAAFLTRYAGRTLEAYRYDVRWRAWRIGSGS